MLTCIHWPNKTRKTQIKQNPKNLFYYIFINKKKITLFIKISSVNFCLANKKQQNNKKTLTFYVHYLTNNNKIVCLFFFFFRNIAD